MLQFLNNLDLISVGIACAAIVVLGFSIYFHNRTSITSRSFLLLSIMASAWSAINYLFYQFANPIVSFWLLRGVMFFAVWFAFSIFQLFYVFPLTNVVFPSSYKRFLLPITSLISLLTLTPLVFRAVSSISSTGQIQTVASGPGIITFAFMVMGLNISGIGLLIKKTTKAKGLEKKQFKTVLWGIAVTLSLIVIFNFIFPAFLNNPSFVPFGAIFILPFIAFTSYSIFKHHLMNIKIIATEILTFALAVAMLVEVILSSNPLTLLLRSSIFLLVLAVGVLLIRSVRKEVEQREQLQILTGKLEKANKQLKILDKARAEFITMASHQLRTPPSSIKWHLSAVLAGDFGEVSPEVKTVITKANLTNNALISLIEDMLNVSRIERGKMQFAFEPTDMREITQMTVDLLAPMAEFKKIKLVFNKPKTILPVINADKEKVRQVINNLVDNAIKYTQAGQVAVSLDKTDKDVILKVTDTGKGVPKGEIGKIFEKFSRGKDSQNYSAGLGLGLYLAQVVINQHQGKIWAESPGINKGSIFAFSLPIKSPLKSDSSTLDLTKNQNSR